MSEAAEAPPLSLGARLSEIARQKPDAPALTDFERTLTFAELDRRSNQVARGLAKAGVKFGDIVSIGLPNKAGFHEVAYGLWKIGAVPQMLSWRLPRHEADAILAALYRREQTGEGAIPEEQLRIGDPRRRCGARLRVLREHRCLRIRSRGDAPLEAPASASRNAKRLGHGVVGRILDHE